jgi:hypothetical protein
MFEDSLIESGGVLKTRRPATTAASLVLQSALVAVLVTLPLLYTEALPQGWVRTLVVYVCACLQTQSCSCMTEAKMEGPCACGTQGGPPMKAVAPDRNWAKQNRDALAK